MSRPRDRESAKGLLPLMEARPWADGKTISYRYHPRGGKPINLGTDKVKAVQAVLDMNGDSSDRGTVAELWRLYQDSSDWKALAAATRTDYTQCSTPLIGVFGEMAPDAITPSQIRHYMRVHRKDAEVRANREAALLSNLFNLAIDRGELEANPCRQVRRNKERPRKKAPDGQVLERFLAWAQALPGQPPILAGMAEFAALAGNRRIEFRELSWPQVSTDVLRLRRAKQREEEGNEVIEVIAVSAALQSLLDRMRTLAHCPRLGWVFPNRDGNAYSDQTFKLGWNRLMHKALKAKVLTPETRFTFHDLRAYYVTRYKAMRGALPDLHNNPATTASVYDRSREVKRDAL